ncbi:MAG TPA: RNA 2',3'-cyclic phosphodiesterase [Prolixibacteraceae bacterium]|jgi:2'-5' RNA ligase|nr:RNA 2',3'-cyclic phosphodiesterase [Prolixibacteraceae bacterium]
MKRLFIGVPIQSERAMHLVQDWSADPLLNRNRMVWTKPYNWHITFFFLGATPESQLAILQQLINDAFNDAQSITGQLTGVGVFPEKGKPRILWMGLENLQPLLASYGLLENLLLKNGFHFDPKPLKPHLTLARIKSLSDRPSLELLLNQYKSYHFATAEINRVTLFESVSSKAGIIYESLYEKWLLKL